MRKPPPVATRPVPSAGPSAAASPASPASLLAIRADSGGVTLRVRVTPKARREGILGVQGDALRVAVRAVPERGEANRAVEKLLAGVLGVPGGAVAVERGGASRDKSVRVAGLAAEEVRRRLAACVPLSGPSEARPRTGASPEGSGESG